MDKATFDAALIKGWKHLGYVRNYWAIDAKGSPVCKYGEIAPPRATTTKCCAIGAVAYTLGQPPLDVADSLGEAVWDKVAGASNAAGSRKQALIDVLELEW